MEEISKFFDTLYSHFVIRDIAAKVLPGLLALFSIVKIFRPDISYTSGLLVDIPDVFKAVVLYGVGFVSGVLLQYVGMKSGLTITHVWPKTEANTSEFNSVDRAISFLVEVDSKHPLARKRERMIVLKTAEEIELIARASNIVAKSHRALLQEVKPGYGFIRL